MRVIVIGGGAGGMMAAGYAAGIGDEVILLEKNEKLGKKLYITGKGRCNITNDCDMRTFLRNVVSNSKFVIGALSKFSPADTIEFCKEYGCPTKVERGNRVFPLSDKSVDFIKALHSYMIKNKVDIRINSTVEDILIKDNHIIGVKADGEILLSDKVILATGGKSYEGTGSNGDGYKFAKKLGHRIIPIVPALVGLDLKDKTVKDLAGLSLKNVTAGIKCRQKLIFSEFGEMLFTHTGVSGPIILSLSSRINRIEESLILSIDLKPALTEKELDLRIIREFENNNNKEFRNALSTLTVKALLPQIILRSGINPYKKVNQITKEERLKLVTVIKNLEYDIEKLCPLSTAIVTAGGIDVKEINPKNMESKLITGLHFAGEVMDIDALTGGFNIQLALSTGRAAGGH